MVVESNEPATELNGDITVAGVAHRGTDVDEEELWDQLDQYADDLEDKTISDDRYGVLYDLDENSGEFTYVAGVEVESTDGLDPELTVVEIPETTYAVFTPTAETVDEIVLELQEEWMEDSDQDHVPGPLFERYDPDENPLDPADSFEFYVPIDED